MGMTMAQKILARHSDRTDVEVGEYVTARVDQVCMYDNFPSIDKGMKDAGIEEVLTRIWDRERVVILIDHTAPAMD